MTRVEQPTDQGSPFGIRVMAGLSRRQAEGENGWVRVAAATLLRAYKDLFSKGERKKERIADARHFFESGEFHLYADLAGIPYSVLLQGFHSVLRKGRLPDGFIHLNVV